jgi:hypothetical protein
MDEHTAQIEHLIAHYLHRDLFRIHARDYLHRVARPRPSAFPAFDTYNMPVSFYKCNGATAPEDWQIIDYTVHRTRESLKRSKSVTLHYLHDLLHAEPMLSAHEHTHADGVIFTYVIHEADF